MWPDAYVDAAGIRPVDGDKTLLEVGRGDTLHWTLGDRDERHTVSEVFIKRSWPPFPENKPVACGRWILDELRVT